MGHHKGRRSGKQINPVGAIENPEVMQAVVPPPPPAPPPVPHPIIAKKNEAPKSSWARFKEWFKTPLDKLYEDLHAAEKKLEEIQWTLKSPTVPQEVEKLRNELSQFVGQKNSHVRKRTEILNKISALEINTARLNFDAARISFQQQCVKLKEIIKNLKKEITTYKANRRWYDISKWSTNEKIARIWFAFIYALLCGISINASINAMEIALPLTLLGLTFPLSVLLGLIGAAITFSVNLSGFWDNVAKLFDEGDRSELKGKYSVFYGLFCTFFIGAASVLSTGLAISTIPGVFGLSNFAILFPLFVIFGSTAYALQGLFTQQPRKWFKSFAEHGFFESIRRTSYRLWYGLVEDDPTNPFLDKPIERWFLPKTSLGSIAHGIARVSLFAAFTGITTWASSMMAPYAAQVTTGVLVDMLGFMTKGAIFNLGITGLGFVVPTVGFLFVAGSLCYNAALSGKLAVLATPFFERVGAATFNAFVEPIRWYNTKYPMIDRQAERKAVRAVLIYPALLAAGAVNFVYQTLSFFVEKEISCWSEARDYARTQYYKKDAAFIWPHFIARLLYNHMPIWGAANALNNGALTAYSKFNGQDVKLGDLSQKEIIEASTAVASGTTRSYGFFWLTQAPRDKEMQAQENAIELEDIPSKKYECTHTYWWSKPGVPLADEVEKTGRMEYDTYFDSIAARERPEI